MDEPTFKAADPTGLEEHLHYHFHDISYLEKALTHPSSTADQISDNERYEFFGDSILDFIICEYLFYAFPHRAEGELTEVKSAVVRRVTLAEAGRALDLRPYLALGRGIANRKDLPDSVYANVFEAIVAAIYIDGGMDPARKFVLQILSKAIEEVRDLPLELNYKSVLQQELQRDLGVTPKYKVIETCGPDHNKSFLVAAMANEDELGRGEGPSKKMAEQEAARLALETLQENAKTDTQP